MDVYWTVKAQGDLERVYLFALQYSRQHADDILDRLLNGSFDLARQPAMGKQQARYLPREVRKIVFDDYEMYYEVKSAAIFIVDLWHTKEER